MHRTRNKKFPFFELSAQEWEGLICGRVVVVGSSSDLWYADCQWLHGSQQVPAPRVAQRMRLTQPPALVARKRSRCATRLGSRSTADARR